MQEGSLRAARAPAGTNSRMESWWLESKSGRKLLMGKTRKFLHWAPVWTQLVSGCFHQVTASDEQSQACPSPPHKPSPCDSQNTLPYQCPAGHQQANLTASWWHCPQSHTWEFANQAPCFRHWSRFSLRTHSTRSLGEGGVSEMPPASLANCLRPSANSTSEEWLPPGGPESGETKR